MEDCIFCKIIRGEIPSAKVFEDEDVIAFLDIGPVSKGHVLVVPKEHAEKIHELSEDTAHALMRDIGLISEVVQKSLDCDFNILNNTGKLAGQLVSHVHFHIIPRTGKEGFSINWTSTKYDDGEMDRISKMIRDGFLE